jgi:hypothetical protein
MSLTMNRKPPEAFQTSTPHNRQAQAWRFLFGRTPPIPRKRGTVFPLVRLTMEREKSAFFLQQGKDSVRSVRHPF